MTAQRPLVQKKRCSLQFEELETRLVPAGIEPTALEQVMLERLNDIRENPAAYGQEIGVDLSHVSPSQPLAFDKKLILAARRHSNDMNINAYFSHTSLDGQRGGERIRNEGFPWAYYGESLAAGFATPDDALEGLIIDAGISNLGHRRHLLAIDNIFKDLHQAGIGIVENGTGPHINYFTIETAKTVDTRPFLTGSVFNDANENGTYDGGEGVGNVQMTVHGVGTMTTFASGGYSLQLNPGTYVVTFQGSQLPSPVTKTVTLGAHNYRLNVLTNEEAGVTDNNPNDTNKNNTDNNDTTGNNNTDNHTNNNPNNHDDDGTNNNANNGIHNRWWVDEVSQRLLRRQLTVAEMESWGRYLDQGGSRDEVIKSFLESYEFQHQRLVRWVENVGYDFLRRPVTQHERDYWVNYVENGGAKEWVVSHFMEATGLYGAAPEVFLNKLTQSLLWRNLTPQELGTWVRYINYAGAAGRIHAIRIFSGSEEFLLKTHYRNIEKFAWNLTSQPLGTADIWTWARRVYYGGSETNVVSYLLQKANVV